MAGAVDAPAHRAPAAGSPGTTHRRPCRRPKSPPRSRSPPSSPCPRQAQSEASRPARGAGPPTILHSSRARPLRRGQSGPKLRLTTKSLPPASLSPASAAPLSRAISAKPGSSAGATAQNGEHGPSAASGSSQPRSLQGAASRPTPVLPADRKGRVQERRRGVRQRPARLRVVIIALQELPCARTACRHQDPRPDAPPPPAAVTSGWCRAARCRARHRRWRPRGASPRA